MPCPLPCQGKLKMGFGDRPNLELLRAVGELQQRCAILKEENQMLVRLGSESWVLVGAGGRQTQTPRASASAAFSSHEHRSKWELHGADMTPRPGEGEPLPRVAKDPTVSPGL